jgi:predicted  nucleic acid-binding Zn-ribbon protein
MDVLKQLEAKLQTLVQQRNDLKDEVARLKASSGEELERLRAEVQGLKAEREEVRKDVEAILRLVEDLG